MGGFIWARPQGSARGPGQQSVTSSRVDSSRDPLAARSVRWGFAAVTMSPDKTQWTYQIVA